MGSNRFDDRQRASGGVLRVAILAFAVLMATSCVFRFDSPTQTRTGDVFYLDPENGDPENDGSSDRPWRTVRELFDGGLIETRAYVTLPWKEGAPMRTVNEGAPVGPGDTLVLRSGYYGELLVYEAFNEREISIVAEEGAEPRFSRVHIRGAAKWRLSGLSVSASYGEAPPSDAQTLVFLESHGWRGPCEDIIIEGCHVFTVPDEEAWTDGPGWDQGAENGIMVQGGKGHSILGNRLENVNFGISVAADSCLVRGNVIDVFCGDALRGLGDDCVFEGNLVKNALVVNGNHADGFQSWAIDGDPPERVVLRGNTILQWDGPRRPELSLYLQGIGLFDGPYVNWTIENNLIVTDMYHGITVSGGVRCVIVNNTVADEQPGNDIGPWIMVGEPAGASSRDACVVRNNAAPSVSGGRFSVVDHNLRIAEEDYSSIFVSAAGMDFHLDEGSPLVDAGSDRSAPGRDLEGRLRWLGKGYDVGCYESF